MLIDGEGPGLPHPRDPFAQCGPNIVIQQEGLAVQGIDGEEIRPTADTGAPVIRHAAIIFDWRVVRALRKLLYAFLRRATPISPSNPDPNSHAAAGTGTAATSPGRTAHAE